jgi:Family of unknown function (DUF6178)
MAEQPGSLLAGFHAKLSEPRGARKIDALLSEDDAGAAVAALAPGELFELVHEAGFEECSELIALATPEQLQGCLDFEVWDKDEYLTAAFHPWLAVLLEAGFEKVGEVWAGLDVEARMLWMQRHVQVFDVTMGEGPEEDDDDPMMTTSDGFFILKLLGDDESQRLTMRLVEDLYRADANLARHTIQGARSEPAADLEEHSYRWRSGRMADLGYVDFHEALELFRPLEVEQLKMDEDDSSAILDATSSSAPVSVAREVLARPFLARALAEIERPAELSRIEGAILYLVNRVLAAARAKPGQKEVVERAAQYASATLSLGLEAASRGDVRRAATALGQIALPRLFRVGYTLGLRLAKLALALAPRTATAEPPARDVVAALSSPRPLWPRSADVGPPVAGAPTTGVRPFESLADLKRAAFVLSGLTVRVALVEGLGVDLLAMARSPEPRPTLETHLRTALLRAMGGGAWTSQALSAAELAAARTRAFADDGTLTQLARRRAHEAVAQSLPPEQLLAGAAALPRIVDDLLDQLQELLGEVTDAEADPRFLDGILVEPSRPS